ncbi:hypothetical protein L249_1030 [Ophiocordyceps polyrhachis-furcata BCC 54312]|uniref:SET domain-containing protein n=1 Tax=Ophiocordyceps polyrhachis-furcata BCC 54312 TaxID=1330021 RepID=A0A367LFV6_9HYPO|nr:hypothetical protein L249_1030 [Ophiocordyceps polyrhachis-furcata BCC 54312]
MSSSPSDTFPAWARLYGLLLSGIHLRDIEGKGLGFVRDDDVDILLKVPHDLLLSVDDYAKVDANFKQLLEAVGDRSTRSDAVLFLLCHLVHSRRDRDHDRALIPTPWTDYLRLLPRSVPVPTMWSKSERQLLSGTSLEPAVDAKLAALTREFDRLRDETETMPFWNALLWEGRGSASLDDWILCDAWFRSRCLELPDLGVAMVPGLDMVNHSSRPTAYYEVNTGTGHVELCAHPGGSGQEVTISYGEAKSAAEMLFSYGFVDADGAFNTLTLPIAPLLDDPSLRYKLSVFGRSPVVTLRWEDAALKWESPFAYLSTLSEEDGLKFRLVQDTAGVRQLRLFWQNEDITERILELETLVESHHLGNAFRLRAVALVHERVDEQLARIKTHVPPKQIDARDACAAAATALREAEKGLLEAATEALELEASMDGG